MICQLWMVCPPLVIGTIDEMGYIEMPVRMLLSNDQFFDCADEKPKIDESIVNRELFILQVAERRGLLFNANWKIPRRIKTSWKVLVL